MTVARCFGWCVFSSTRAAPPVSSAEADATRSGGVAASRSCFGLVCTGVSTNGGMTSGCSSSGGTAFKPGWRLVVETNAFEPEGATSGSSPLATLVASEIALGALEGASVAVGAGGGV